MRAGQEVSPAEEFRPSRHGCRFPNAATVGLPIRLGRIRIASVTGGMCGGMVLESLRRWRSGLPPASGDSADVSATFGALLRSFQIPTAPLHYLRLQRPGSAAARRRTNLRTATRLTALIDAQGPIPLALVCRLSENPFALAAHHVVLAYAALPAVPGEFAIYDPNHPGDDHVRLQITPDAVRHIYRSDVHAAFILRAR